jgi:hypothetical protein
MYSSGMKYLRLALIVAATPAVLMAQLNVGGSDDQDQQQQPEELPDFSGLNEYIYVPKTTVFFGARLVTGAKMTFTGRADIVAPETYPTASVPTSDATGTYIYHDGTIGPDSRQVVVDNGDGTSTSAPIAPDGKTNTWSYDNTSQLQSDGLMQMDIYSAVVPQIADENAKGKSTSGMEMGMARDMGKISGRLSWKLVGGMSLNDIRGSKIGAIQSDVTTLTDTYDLFGQTPPVGQVPYTSPNQTTNDVYDSSGNLETDSSGNPITQTSSSTTLIGNQAINRTVTTGVDYTSVVDTWRVHGAYLMFRGGPELDYDFTDKLRLSVSVGPALLFSGTDYDVDQVFTTATGAPISNIISNTTERLVPAVYADATLQYLLNDRTGLYVGAVFQDGGSYTETAQETAASNPEGASATYTTKIDFSDEQGFRTGLSFKF